MRVIFKTTVLITFYTFYITLHSFGFCLYVERFSYNGMFTYKKKLI